MTDFVMPSLGADMDEGTLVEWLVRPGDRVSAGDPVAVVDTAKAAIEVETFESGVVEELLVDPGQKVAVGTPMAHLGAGLATVSVVAAEPAVAHEAAVVAPRPRRPTRVTPLVRKRARELGVDLTSVEGTGRAGAITRADVERTADARPTAPAGRPLEQPVALPVAVPSEQPAAGERRRRVSPYARRLAASAGVDAETLAQQLGHTVHAADIPTNGAAPGEAAAHVEEAAPASAPTPVADPMRAAIAELMSRSKREIPHYYLQATVDLGAAVAWMEARNRELSISHRLVPGALIAKAVALSAVKCPELNGFWRDGFVAADGVHLGMAISLRRGGMVAPAIHHADQLTVDELMARLRDLVTRARSGRLRRAEMSDPTLTLTNLGDQGVDLVQGVIYPPQVALVGVGRVTPRVLPVDGLIGVRPSTVITLAADHRATDGFVGARFLRHIDHLLQIPEEW